MMSALCPHCGYDLRIDEPIESGEMHFDPRGQVLWHGAPLHIRPQQRIILHSLLKAEGRTLPCSTLAERMGYEGDNPSMSVKAMVHHLRREAPDIPIETVWGLGYRWAA